ncbi:TRAPP subunit trs31 [Gaertneriomyces sp. JEL0708]|nr:TRAPP subunit trs31 [Gaertneriomyces sp. JEL0708]
MSGIVSRSSPRSKPSILERNLTKGRNNEVSLSAFAFLFAETLSYSTKKSSGIQDMEKKLSDIGYRVGIRFLELIIYRDRPNRRDTRLLQVLSFIHTTLWKTLFGRPADSLERGTDNEDEYMISDNEPMIQKFVAVPKEMSQLSCGAFMAGIVDAVLQGSGFPARVSAHATGTDAFPLRTTILMKFDRAVLVREKASEAR